MISVRNDDVLLSSSSHPNPLKKFKGVHELICKAPNHLIHVPTILVDDIQKFPEAVSYIKEETLAGRMRPELHGYQHIDYGKLDKQEVKNQLSQAASWFVTNLGYFPTKWYTPWGASQQHLHEVAKDLNLELVDCSNTTKMVGRYGVLQKLKEGQPLDSIGEIIIHWWKGQDIFRLDKLIQYINTGDKMHLETVLK